MSPRWQYVVSAVATNCLRGEDESSTRRQEFLPLAKGENQRMKRMLLSWSGFSRGMRILSHAEAAEARIDSLACGLRGACFLTTDGTNGHGFLFVNGFHG